MKNRHKLLIAGAVALTALVFVQAKSNDDKQSLSVVQSVDLNRYAGKWYEIARLPNRFEDQCAGDVTATYTLRKDGRVGVVNQCRKKNGEIDRAEGIARVVDKQTNAKLKVRFAPSWISFLPFVWGDYWIIDLAPDYSYSVVGEPGRDYLWILSRTPTISDDLYKELVGKIESKGFDAKRLIRVEQTGK
jgi:apolipoprotein D and lipocalin family protein